LAAVATLAGVSDAVLVQFSSDTCQPCRAMQPTVSRLVTAGYPVQRIDVDRHPETARQFGIRSLPTFVLLVGNREVSRVEGAASYDRLVQMFGEIGTESGGRVVAAGRGDTGREGEAPAEPPSQVAPASFQSTDFRGGASPDQAALAASVRLKVEDAKGYGFGTGTIIDTHGDEALVVTCGHIFRESQGKGRIEVNLFAPGATQPVAGELLACDLDRDIALVGIKPGITVTPVAVAPAGYAVRPRDRVFTVGCDKGADATVRQSEITAVNKYLGKPNYTAAGAPIDGRSGGGLFSADGLLIGVCNAADPRDDEGLYAGLASIHWQLDQIGQTEIYQRQATPQPAAETQDAAVALASAEAPVAPPRLFEPPAAAPLIGSDTELVVIIRSKRKPDQRSEIYVVDQASPELLTGIVQAARQGAQQRAAAIAAGQTAADVGAPRFAQDKPFAPRPVVRGQSAE
jgi:thiol-disulfide isomerase/thioredoxin